MMTTTTKKQLTPEQQALLASCIAQPTAGHLTESEAADRVTAMKAVAFRNSEPVTYRGPNFRAFAAAWNQYLVREANEPCVLD